MTFHPEGNGNRKTKDKTSTDSDDFDGTRYRFSKYPPYNIHCREEYHKRQAGSGYGLHP
jgi:hypothetical protein